MTKRTSSQNRAKRQARFVAIISYTVAFLLLMTAAVGVGYYFGFASGKAHAERVYGAERDAMKKMLTQLQQQAALPPAEPALAETQTPELAKRLQGVLKREQEKQTAAHEYPDDENVEAVEKPVERPVRITSDLPKLAIIVDDVAFERDVRMIKDLKIPLTMSFLPPSPNHPSSAKLAAKEDYYMIHLPLEAKNFSAEEPSTLRLGQSQQEIIEHVAELKRQFPRARFVNNHTGSTFTADENAMNRLVFALNKYGMGFIDSRTTAETKVPVVMQSLGRPYLARDVFLDHHPDIDSIKEQIRRAVALAKKHGSAIAICHPHKKTLEALAQSRAFLNKEVQLVRIDKLI